MLEENFRKLIEGEEEPEGGEGDLAKLIEEAYNAFEEAAKEAFEDVNFDEKEMLENDLGEFERFFKDKLPPEEFEERREELKKILEETAKDLKFLFEELGPLERFSALTKVWVAAEDAGIVLNEVVEKMQRGKISPSEAARKVIRQFERMREKIHKIRKLF